MIPGRKNLNSNHRRKKTVLLDELESVIHETTVAALVDLVAVHELLLRKRDELAGLEEVGTLDSTSGGEGLKQ